MGSDESHFNFSLIVKAKVTRQCPQATTFEEKGELKRIQTEVPLLTSLTLTARPNNATYGIKALSNEMGRGSLAGERPVAILTRV